MYEKMTFEHLVSAAMKRVPDYIDKRQGSIIYDAIAPAIAEITQMYITLDHVLTITFADSSYGEYLERRTQEQGIFRKAATCAIRLGRFLGKNQIPLEIDIGMRFNMEDVNYSVYERISAGEYRLQCETAGELGNIYFGVMTPIGTVKGLVSAELCDLLIPGGDEEDDERLFARYAKRILERPFGGNKADYVEKLMEIQGVGAVKLKRAWAGGGTVKAYLLDSEFDIPSDELINVVQAAADPAEYHGEGIGFAPFFHVVSITKAEARPVNAELFVQPAGSLSLGQLQEVITAAIENYFLTLRTDWQKSAVVVRISAIEQAALATGVIVDVQNTRLNGVTDNLIFDEQAVPVLGEVFIREI